MDWKSRADELLAEFDACCKAKIMHNAVQAQIAKDNCAPWAYHLATQRGWGTDSEIAEACYQLEPRLTELKKKIILEVLNGPIRN
jgi:hypothetical protein